MRRNKSVEEAEKIKTEGIDQDASLNLNRFVYMNVFWGTSEDILNFRNCKTNVELGCK